MLECPLSKVKIQSNCIWRWRPRFSPSSSALKLFCSCLFFSAVTSTSIQASLEMKIDVCSSVSVCERERQNRGSYHREDILHQQQIVFIWINRAGEPNVLVQTWIWKSCGLSLIAAGRLSDSIRHAAAHFPSMSFSWNDVCPQPVLET